MTGFPTRDRCNLDDPQEMFLPLLVALPVTDKTRLAFPVVYLRLVSEHLYRLGAFMKCPECGHVKRPLRVWKAPQSATPHWLSDPGQWKPTHRKQPVGKKRSTRSVIPTRELCNLDDPRQMFAWMLTGLPLMRGAPMLFDADWAMDVSEHLSEGGAMLKCPECSYARTPETEYVPPDLSGPHWLTSPGEWVPYGEKPRMSLDDEIDASLAKMSARQQAELFKALKCDEEGVELPDTPAANVVAGMPARFKTAILKRLRDRDSA